MLKELRLAEVGAPSPYCSLLEALVELHRGKHDVAQALLHKLARTSLTSDPRPAWLLAEYSADILLEQGKFDEALPLIDDLLPRVTALVPRGDVATELYRRRAECLLHAGKVESGLEAIREAESIAQECGDVYELACALRVLALLLARQGKPVEAQAAFARSFQFFDEIQTPYEWGKLWMSYGDWLCSEHASHYFSLKAAGDAYRAALEHFDSMRSEHKFAEVQSRLDALEKRLQSERDQLAADSEIRPRPRRKPLRDVELNRRSQWSFETYGIVTRYRPLLDMLEEVARLSVSDIPVLVLGESGTGKELVSHAIHELSGRVGDYMAINCSAIQATMLEAELFGFVRGSFTGAERDKPGLFEIAHQGSLFLDEIGEMSPDLQSKLLRFLENGSFRRVGSTSDVKVKVRIIAATNREQARLASGQGFRSDLYFRLAHAVYTLPPLREREGDAEVLIDHFLEVFGEETGKRVRLSSAARDRLLEYTWPGNVRQLRGLVHRLVAQSEREQILTPRDIKLEEAAAPRDFLEEMESEERKRILDALEKSGGVKANAARMLRLSRTTMLAKMKRYGIPL
jgi:DNA-binding NtrC family response regulator